MQLSKATELKHNGMHDIKVMVASQARSTIYSYKDGRLLHISLDTHSVSYPRLADVYHY